MESARRAFPVVKPVVANGIRYDAMRRAKDHGFTQSGGVVSAVNEKSGEILWMVQLYTNTYDTAEERDVQDVYIRELALAPSGQALLATDGRRRVWSVDLATRVVTPVDGPDRP